MMTSQQLIERLQDIQNQHGVVYVAIEQGEDLPDLRKVSVVKDEGQTGEMIIVLQASI